MIKIHPFLFILLCLTFSTSILINAQSKQGFLLKGHIDNYQDHELYVQAGKELIIFSERITTDSVGNFQYWLPEKSSSGHLSLSTLNGYTINLYTDRTDSILVNWSDANPAKILKIKFNDKPDTLLVQWLNSLNALRIKNEGTLDTCTDENSFFRKIQEQHDSENTLLKKIYSKNNAIQYDQYAMDIFYHNMNLILNSKFYKCLEFSDAHPFPQISLYSRAFEKINNANFDRMKKENPKTDTTLVKRFSVSEVKNHFRANYSVIDTVALARSSEYKFFIGNYFTKLADETSSRKLGINIFSSNLAYVTWLKSLVSNEKILQWLIASRLENQILNNSIKTKAELIEQLKMLNSSTALQNELKSRWAFQTQLVAGKPAPDLDFLTFARSKSSLKTLRGKYVYINFWDSNCAPCLTDIMNYSKTVAEKYATKNVTFLYISLDDDNESWKKSLKKISPVGINGRIEKGWRGTAIKDYSIIIIPRHLIITPEGMIQDPHADSLQSLLLKDPFK